MSYMIKRVLPLKIVDPTAKPTPIKKQTASDHSGESELSSLATMTLKPPKYKHVIYMPRCISITIPTAIGNLLEKSVFHSLCDRIGEFSFFIFCVRDSAANNRNFHRMNNINI